MLLEQNFQQLTIVIKKLNCCLKQIEILRKKYYRNAKTSVIRTINVFSQVFGKKCKINVTFRPNKPNFRVRLSTYYYEEFLRQYA